MTDASYRIVNREYLLISVGKLHPHPRNANRGDGEAIAESMEVNGFYGAVTVHDHPELPGEYEILAGEHRWREAVKGGLGEVPCIVVDTEDPRHAARVLLADNETAKRSSYDPVKLTDLIRELGDVTGTGFNLAGLADVETERQSTEPPEGGDEPEFVREYGVVVYCDGEADQEAKYNQCRELGWKVRVASI